MLISMMSAERCTIFLAKCRTVILDILFMILPFLLPLPPLDAFDEERQEVAEKRQNRGDGGGRHQAAAAKAGGARSEVMRVPANPYEVSLLMAVSPLAPTPEI